MEKEVINLIKSRDDTKATLAFKLILEQGLDIYAILREVQGTFSIIKNQKTGLGYRLSVIRNQAFLWCGNPFSNGAPYLIYDIISEKQVKYFPYHETITDRLNRMLYE